MSLTDDEVRERFSPFHDGELPPDEAKIVRERIESSAALSAEFEDFKRVMGGLAVLAAHGAHGSPDGGAQPKATIVPEVAAVVAGTKASADTSARVSVVSAAKSADDDGDRASVLPED